MNRPQQAALCLLATLLIALTAGATTAQAHPLGNFSINRLDQLRLFPDRIEDTATVDSAEIPTAQDREATDTDHDSRISPAEATARAVTRCTDMASGIRTSVNGRQAAWRVVSSALAYRPGAADLPTAQLACALAADTDLTRPSAITFTSGADGGRVGWKEITATAGGRIRLTDSSVPGQNISGGLTAYPQGLLDQPLGVLTAELHSAPGDGTTLPAGTGQATNALPPPTNSWVLFPGLERRLGTLVGTRDLTLPVGLLAVALSLLLGAGHAALPGHAKLAVGACLAQRRGGLRAALAVGATVTATHTAGVLLVGLALTASAGLAGERVLGLLGATGGVLITGVGAALLLRAVRTLRRQAPAQDHHHGPDHGHGLDHGFDHDHDHGHPHGHHHHPHRHDGAPEDPAHPHRRRPVNLTSLLGIGLAGGLVPSPSALVVLLGAVALGRTLFGVLLVIGYGVGMALALAAAGALLAGGSTRLAEVTARRLPTLRRLAPYSSLLTASVVLTVGLGLTLRGLPACD
ncbi:nickel transporter [Kitasatospora sp. NBC_00315]|uniref:HoxN/HupN/NixA family nickel/cobalt transporter n=1 Tax=Kitasatospora sp. NBC_00315 TaxID=2975963 RepID=UPI0032565625